MTKSTTTPQAIVIVPGHDILVDATLALVDKGWVAGFPGEAVARMLHIWVAIAYATAQGNAIVVFSGGVTKLQTTLSEAQSYFGRREVLPMDQARRGGLAARGIRTRFSHQFHYKCAARGMSCTGGTPTTAFPI